MPRPSQSVWEKDLGRSLEFPPVIRGETLYTVVTDKKINCLDVSTGKKRWGKTLEGAPVTGPVPGDSVVVVATGYRDPHVQSYDRFTGKELAKRETRVTGVVALSGDRFLLGFDSGVLECVQGRTLETVWQVRAGKHWCSPPAVDRVEERIFAPAEPDSILFFDFSGNRAGSLAPVLPHPTLQLQDHHLLLLDGTGNAWTYDTRTLSRIRSLEFEGEPAGAAVNSEGTEVVSLRSGRIQCLSSSELSWEETAPAPLVAPPVIFDEWVFQALPRGMVHVLDLNSGAVLKRLQHRERVPAAPVYSSKYGLLVVPGSHGTLAAYSVPE